MSLKIQSLLILKKSITGRLEGSNTEKEVEIDLPLKHLSNFWKTLVCH